MFVVNFAELRVLCWKLHPTIYENDQELTKIREDMGYNYMVIFYLSFNFILLFVIRYYFNCYLFSLH